MGGSKRMSQEEKRQVILGIYHKTKTVYTEKEIHTLAAKAGVNANTYVRFMLCYTGSHQISSRERSSYSF